MAEERKQPRFSQFALAAARDTSGFGTKTVAPEGPLPADGSRQPASNDDGEIAFPREQAQPVAAGGEPKAAPKAPRAAKPSVIAEPPAQEELVSFTVRLPASLYMRMRRSLGLREKLGELCVNAITRELDLRS